MRPPEHVRRDLTELWLRKARGDAEAAAILLEHLSGNYESVGFHAQQTAEKSLKALLVAHGVEFPKTHDIARLLDLVATVDAELAEELRDAERLTTYGTEERYPSERPAVTKSVAEALIKIAGMVDTAVRARLAVDTREAPPAE